MTSLIGGEAPSSEKDFQSSLLASILKFSTDAIISKDLHGIITSWNSGAERLYGYTAEEMIGKTRQSILHPESDEENLNEVLEKFRQGKAVLPFEELRMNRQGQAIWVSISVTPVFDEGRSLIGITGIAQDITERKKYYETAADLATIVEKSFDSIAKLTLDGVITSWNRAAESTYGYSAEEMIGRTLDHLARGGTPDRFAIALDQIRKDEIVAPYEVDRVTKDGHIITSLTTISGIFEKSGAAIGAIAISRDISDLKRTTQRQRILATIVDTSEDAIWSTDLEGTVKSWNAAAEAIFEWSAGETIGQNISFHFPREKEKELAWIIEKVKAGGKLKAFETIRLSKSGRAIPVSVTISPVYDEEDEIIGKSIIARDITEHKQMMARLEEANLVRSEFVAMVAHDIRSPVAAISGFAHLILDQWDSIGEEDKLVHLKVIARNTENLAKFVEDVLQVSRIESGEFPFKKSRFNIVSLVERALSEVASTKDAHKFNLIAEKEILLVFGDEDRQWQILINLLSNAAKFSPSNKPITVEISIRDDLVEVAVKDQGIGIAIQDQSKLFEKFGRVTQSGGKKVPGTGLGLYICKILVQAQGGTIWCESSKGKGSSFSYTIPKSQ